MTPASRWADSSLTAIVDDGRVQWVRGEQCGSDRDEPPLDGARDEPEVLSLVREQRGALEPLSSRTILCGVTSDTGMTSFHGSCSLGCDVKDRPRARGAALREGCRGREAGSSSLTEDLNAGSPTRTRRGVRLAGPFARRPSAIQLGRLESSQK